MRRRSACRRVPMVSLEAFRERVLRSAEGAQLRDDCALHGTRDSLGFQHIGRPNAEPSPTRSVSTHGIDREFGRLVREN